MASGSNGGSIGFVGDLPLINYMVETPEERAAASKLAEMQGIASQYELFRRQNMQGRQQAIGNMAGMLGPLNEFVRQGTDYGIDLGAATTPVVMPPPMPVPVTEQQPAPPNLGNMTQHDPRGTGLSEMAYRESVASRSPYRQDHDQRGTNFGAR